MGAAALKNFNVDLRAVRLEVEKLMQSGPEMNTMGRLPQTPHVKKAIQLSMEAARDLNQNFLGTEHLLLGLARLSEGVAAEVLLKLGVSMESLQQQVIKQSEDPEDADKERRPKKSKTPSLDAFTRDITELAREGKLRPVIGRETEINRVATVLSKFNRQNPILIGDPGIGRRSIVNGLAKQIANHTIIDRFAEYRLLELDQAMLVAGTKYRGALEERVKAMTIEMRRSKNVILFVPEIHLFADLMTSDTGITAFEILKHGMIRDKIKCVGICSQLQYESFISTDPELINLFQPMHIASPTKTEVLEILRGIKKNYEDHHRVEIKDESLQAAIELSDLYLVDRPLLSNAINLIDEAGAQLGFHWRAPDTNETEPQSCGTVDVDNVVNAISVETGISEADIRDRKNLPARSGE